MFLGSASLHPNLSRLQTMCVVAESVCYLPVRMSHVQLILLTMSPGPPCVPAFAIKCLHPSRIDV